MPELPDLQVFACNLHARLAGRVVRAVEIWQAKRLNFSKATLSEALQGQTLLEVRREGKETHFHFANGHRLGVHLMLTGQFELLSDPASARFAQLGLAFEPEEWLVVSDPRGWATFTLDPKPASAPDALSSECSPGYLRDRLRQRKGMAIKEFLIDQQMLRGIGNAYADEILWACRIDPRSKCHLLPDKKILDLHAAIRSVLADAIAQIERIAPETISGEIREFLKIHNPKKTHSPTGQVILRIGQKKTYLTREQILYPETAIDMENFMS